MAVIYGAGGGVGGAIARTFAREVAKLFLYWSRRASVDPVAEDVARAGGTADVAEVDALDEPSVERHLAGVIDRAGRIDVMFNAIGIVNTRVQGKPLTELAVEDFLQPITGYARGYFLTARLAARQMIKQGAGVVMTATAVPSRAGIPLVGGFASAEAAVEALTRSLSAELGPHGSRRQDEATVSGNVAMSVVRGAIKQLLRG
ncbi:MAG: SDR family oxidoreductase [Ancalomicrobiaceae bacterium]|nr:SDR family oxidoreductase [Ancalomicrobiaceae bacterium]